MKQSKAISKFNKTIKRTKGLMDIFITFTENEGSTDTGKKPYSLDILRSALVLSVAAMDAYFTDVFVEFMVPFLKKGKINNDLAKILCDSGLDTKEALKLIEMDRPYRRIRTLVGKYYEKTTTQKFNIIDHLFSVYDLKDFTNNIVKKTGKKSIKRSIEIIVEKRHSIVHDGDYNSHGRLKKITHHVTNRRINDDIVTFVTAADEIINNKF